MAAATREPLPVAVQAVSEVLDRPVDVGNRGELELVRRVEKQLKAAKDGGILASAREAAARLEAHPDRSGQ